ncbi:hypothetical protein [Pseudomonas sp. NPDC086278]|uniref:hypothetical protein n=1 Tax=Pseudomonas sp. NPDC086278 TaxID=3390646 RepID=UPI003CFCE7B0
MNITAAMETRLWRQAFQHLGSQGLSAFVNQCMREYVNTSSTNVVGLLRSEWVGVDVLNALSEGLRLAGIESPVAKKATSLSMLNRHRRYLNLSLIQALPPQVVPEELIEFRLHLDIGV